MHIWIVEDPFPSPSAAKFHQRLPNLVWRVVGVRQNLLNHLLRWGKDPLMSWGLWVYPLLKLHLLLAELE